ncbi:hypothetical protein KWF55_05565 [Acinetobacter pittii]|jgi:hypothetical protein|uniref:PIN domain-containing protein n=1 Tax=Acinetobacter TaxID=469 RepID=UPI00178CF444|nr:MULTISPECIES: hypothetical protein [Acinetobacter]MBE2172109.1 hypothetical protein [Acinetobacter oleivorans]MDR9626456.1 hypothetical protein [Acinetobacter baumannii]
MTPEINQSHYGSGDNVARDKIVYSMQSGDFRTVVQSIMSLIQFEKYDETKHKLELLNDIDSKTNEVKNLIKILDIYYNYVVNQEGKEESILKVKHIIRQNSSELIIKDLAFFTLLSLNDLNEKEESISIFNSITDEKGYYVKCIYNKNLASQEELKKYFEENKFLLDLYELVNLCLGFCRVGNYKLANDTIEITKKMSNDRYIQALSIAVKLDEIYPDKKYQPIMYDHRDNSIKIIDLSIEFCENISSYTILIKQEINVLICLLLYTGLTIKALLDLSYRFIDQIRVLDKDLAENLLKVRNIDQLELDEELHSKLENGLRINEEETITLSNLLYAKKVDFILVDQWIKKGGLVELNDEMLEKFFVIFFESYIYLNIENDYKNIECFELSINNFISIYKKEIKRIMPSTLMIFCNNLMAQKKPLFNQIKEVIEPVLSESNFVSPLYKHYLNSLLGLEQYVSLQSRLDCIPEDEWDFELLIIQSSCFAVNGDFCNAKINIDKALDIYKFSAYVWFNKIKIELNILSTLELKDIVNSIPEEVFLNKNDYLFLLLQLISNKIDYVFVQKKLAGLFINDPVGVANEICKIYFSALSENVCVAIDSIDNDLIMHGVEYELNSKTYLKLIIKSNSSFSYFIDSSSGLGETLSRLKIGEIGEYDFNDIKLLNILPADVAIFKIAQEIVEENRHRSKEPALFYSFTVSENNAVEDITKMLSKFDSKDNKKEKLADTSISMYLKGKLILPDNEVEAALGVLQNPLGNSCLFKCSGILEKPSQLILDTYSFIFLCLNGLYKGLKNLNIEVYITSITEKEVKSWVENLSDEKYMKAGLDNGKLIITNADVIKSEYSLFIDAINELISYSNVLMPQAIDVPIHITELKDILGHSVYSSMKDSYSYKIPWLCLDSIINEFFKAIEPDLTINLNSLLIYLNSSLSLGVRKISLYQLVNFSLFTSYNSDDLFQLSCSDDNADIELLSNLILKSPLEFPEDFNFSGIIIDLLENVIIKKNNFINNDIGTYNVIQVAFNYCCEKFINLSSEGSYEDKFLDFYLSILSRVGLSKRAKKIINQLATLYAKGHFLNINYLQSQIKLRISRNSY